MKMLLMVMLCGLAQLVSAQIYVWEDEKGNPVFSNVPPKNGQAEEFKFKEDLELKNLALIPENITGKWTQIESEGNYTTVEFKARNEFIMYKYSQFNAYYQGRGEWMINDGTILVTFKSVINQQSNYKSDKVYQEKWSIDVLYAKELSIILEGKLFKYSR